MSDESRSFFDRNFPAMVTLVIALSGGLFSLVQYQSNRANQKLEQQRQKIETDRIFEQRKNEIRLQIASFVYNGRKEIFSKDVRDKTRMRDVMKATFPFDVYNDVFTEIAKSDPNPNEREFWIKAQTILINEKSALLTTSEIKNLADNKVTSAKHKNVSVNLKGEGSAGSTSEIVKLDPHVRYVVLPEKSEVTGANTYKFYLTVETNKSDNIKKIKYTFNHPSWGKNNSSESANAANNFEVSYKGWGAIHSVYITASYKDGKTITKEFDMFSAGGWR